MTTSPFKTAFLLLAAVITTLALEACHSSSPHWTNTYFHREENVKRICNTLSGTYDIEACRIIRCDKAGTTVVFKDSALWEMLHGDTMEPQYIVGGPGDQRVVVPNFPICLVAPCINDTAVARAVASAPNQNLTLNYQLHAEVTGGEDESKGVIRLSCQPLSLTLSVNGKQRIVEFSFDSNMALGIDGDDPATLTLNYLQISLADVKVMGGDKQLFDNVWENGPDFTVSIHGKQREK